MSQVRGSRQLVKPLLDWRKLQPVRSFFKEFDVTDAKSRSRINYNKDVQMIFQDSMSSLNPRKTIFDIIAEPLRNFSGYKERRLNQKCVTCLKSLDYPKKRCINFRPNFRRTRQRIGIARAVATNPVDCC